MILIITFLVAGHLHFTNPTHVADLHPQHGYSVQLHEQAVNGVKLSPAHPTIVKTWAE